MAGAIGKVAVLWRGDGEARSRATPASSRLTGVFDALAALGIRAVAAVYADDFAEEVRAQLQRLDAVLVDPSDVAGGGRRSTRCCATSP
ncbi:MAG TPA: hypothetical protein VE690_23530, partial [Rhodopila sp.]|nr:hypothetical protein [Rhodopila sp.]